MAARIFRLMDLGAGCRRKMFWANLRTTARFSGEALAPRRRRAGSPGMAWFNTKVTVLIPIRTGISWIGRQRTKLNRCIVAVVANSSAFIQARPKFADLARGTEATLNE